MGGTQSTTNGEEVGIIPTNGIITTNGNHVGIITTNGTIQYQNSAIPLTSLFNNYTVSGLQYQVR